MVKKILIIDDSALMRRVVSDIIETDNRLRVEAQAKNGREGLDLLLAERDRFDVVLVDLRMPVMDGLQFLTAMRLHRIKCATIVVSTLVKEGAKETILALEKGAFDFVLKPSNSKPDTMNEFRSKLIHSIEAATKMGSGDSDRINVPGGRELSNVRDNMVRGGKKEGRTGGGKLVAIACSTGGPKALKEVIPFLSKDLDAPVVLVQHMPVGFTLSLAQRLNELSEIQVKEAEHGEVLKKGWVYVAPGGKHIRIQTDTASQHKIVLSDESPIGGLRPCANVMYKSLTNSSFDDIVCVVLTGMGMDGTEGIRYLKKEKKIYVIAQDEKTSTVYGMPKAITSAGLSDEVIPLEKVADAISKNVGVLNNGR